jgi:pyruvate,water dikinase
VSEGVVTGPVKVLHTPHEKPIEKGDVLVAYTTDPGWTPLFVNAAAVVLEVGGMLQHGAVVAREYGKPCVAGIDGVMTKLQDSQLVEVDGTAGIIRLISPAPANF